VVFVYSVDALKCFVILVFFLSQPIPSSNCNPSTNTNPNTNPSPNSNPSPLIEGIIDGGTWEHRKRALEMLETAAKNLAQTSMGHGNHFMGDFLPKEELEIFLKKADAASTGVKYVKDNDYDENKIAEDNIGFKMLKKAGWTEGQGLGDGGRDTSDFILLKLGLGLLLNLGSLIKYLLS
jgi:hypothetical protein